jgi:hypothetical protein
MKKVADFWWPWQKPIKHAWTGKKLPFLAHDGVKRPLWLSTLF